MATALRPSFRADQAPVVPSGSAKLPDLLRRIGRTPLIELTKVTRGLPATVRVFGKAEFLNPGGSVKDRPALWMVQAGLRAGALGDGQTLIDATSGNTGIAYALLGSALGFPVKLAMPANASPERRRLLDIYGVDLVLTDPMEGTDGAQAFVRRHFVETPNRYFYPDQYNNPANWQAHFEGTGAEILEQTGGRVTHFVAGLGTTGTFVGTVRRLRQHNPAICGVSLQPNSPLHGLEGMKHLQTALVPGIYDATLANENLGVSTEEAYTMTRRLAREEGLLVGPSSGANVAGALRVAGRLDAGVVVTILCDTGMRYLSDPFWTSSKDE